MVFCNPVPSVSKLGENVFSTSKQIRQQDDKEVIKAEKWTRMEKTKSDDTNNTLTQKRYSQHERRKRVEERHVKRAYQRKEM